MFFFKCFTRIHIMILIDPDPASTKKLNWKLEREKLSNANQTLAMILDLLSIMSKDGVSLYLGLM